MVKLLRLDNPPVSGSQSRRSPYMDGRMLKTICCSHSTATQTCVHNISEISPVSGKKLVLINFMVLLLLLSTYACFTVPLIYLFIY